MEDELLMTTLALHIDHKLAPGFDPRIAAKAGEILSRPCFVQLSRVAIHAKNRDLKHQPKTSASIEASLCASDADAAVLDSGRSSDLVASARIWSGRHIEGYDDPKPLLASYVIVPYAAAQRDALLDAFVDLATALQALAGYVAVERDYEHAHRAALSQAPRPEDVRDFPRRARERKAHFWFDKKIDTQISGPDWGVILGPGHLQRVQLASDTFGMVRDAGSSKFVFLSADPEDALTEAFDLHLEAARTALRPVLMDVSSVPVS
jgi:hypothetical protein